MVHEHEPEPHLTSTTDSGVTSEHCYCGASRTTHRGECPSAWHTCWRCTHPFGLPLKRIEGISRTEGGLCQ
jgi:hypothetical protein